MAITLLEFYVPDPPITVQWFGVSPAVIIPRVASPAPTLAAVIGPTGPKGDKGDIGEKGEKGDDGANWTLTDW